MTTREMIKAKMAADRAAGIVRTYPVTGHAGARAASAVAIAEPCPHFGAPTGETRQCQSCRGKVTLTVFACAVHGGCTVAKKVDGLGCCRGCPDDPVARKS